MSNLVKQPNESERYTIDFSKRLALGDSIASVQALTGSPFGLTISDVIYSGSKVQFRASGGVDGTSYKLTVRVSTAQSDIKEFDFILIVKEII